MDNHSEAEANIICTGVNVIKGNTYRFSIMMITDMMSHVLHIKIMLIISIN